MINKISLLSPLLSYPNNYCYKNYLLLLICDNLLLTQTGFYYLQLFCLIFYFWFPLFLSTCIHIVCVCWCILIVGCVVLKRLIFYGSRTWITNQLYQLYQLFFTNDIFFLLSFTSHFSISSTDELIDFKNSPFISFLDFISSFSFPSLNYLSFNCLNFFLILKGYSKPLEVYLFCIFLSIPFQYVCLYSFDVSNDSSLHIMKKNVQMFFYKKIL